MNKKIVIIDDSQEVRELIADSLTKKGFLVFQAELAKVGLSLISECKPSFALIDMRLGDLNGIEVVKRIRKFDKEIKVIIISGLNNCEIEKVSLSAGANAFLSKAIGVEKIVSKVIELNSDSAIDSR